MCGCSTVWFRADAVREIVHSLGRTASMNTESPPVTFWTNRQVKVMWILSFFAAEFILAFAISPTFNGGFRWAYVLGFPGFLPGPEIHDGVHSIGAPFGWFLYAVLSATIVFLREKILVKGLFVLLLVVLVVNSFSLWAAAVLSHLR